VGANLARLQHTASALLSYQENMSGALSLIKDVDIAFESTYYAMQSLKVQTATAILAQSTTLSQSALRLLGVS
jgi:flagellin